MAERVQQCLKGALRNSRACSRTSRGGAPPSRKANQEASTASTSSGGGAAATSDAGAGVAMSLAFGIRCGAPGAAEPHTRRQPGAHLACKASHTTLGLRAIAAECPVDAKSVEQRLLLIKLFRGVQHETHDHMCVTHFPAS